MDAKQYAEAFARKDPAFIGRPPPAELIRDLYEQELMVPEMIGMKDKWQPGEKAHFEYHCYEGHDSADAELWYHSHQVVTVLRPEVVSPHPTFLIRRETGETDSYIVCFEDGLEYAVREDELRTSPAYFYRPAPPPRPAPDVQPDPAQDLPVDQDVEEEDTPAP